MVCPFMGANKSGVCPSSTCVVVAWFASALAFIHY